MIYLNGEFVPRDQAKVSVYDRGLLFADAVYEVVSVIDRRLLDMDRHISRLQRSLAELSIVVTADWLDIFQQLIAANDLVEGMIYLQISRGAADERDFRWPAASVTPTVFAFTKSLSLIDNPLAAVGMRVVTRPDQRWGRCDIKTTQLLYATLMKMEAAHENVDDAWLTRDGYITEGTSQNAQIITKNGVLISHQLDHRVLPGITRMGMMDRADMLNLPVEERPFSVEEAYDAAEAFVSSSTLLIMPVVEIDGHKIGDGRPGELTRRLRQSYIAEVHKSPAR